MGQATKTGRVLSASTLIGDHVYNRQEEDLGKLEDIMLDTEKGCVSYGVLSFGGVMGIGDKLFAVPWQALELDTVNHRFITDIPKEKLENAPGFDKDDWPDMAETTFSSNIHDYYGYTPRY